MKHITATLGYELGQIMASKSKTALFYIVQGCIKVYAE